MHSRLNRRLLHDYSDQTLPRISSLVSSQGVASGQARPLLEQSCKLLVDGIHGNGDKQDSTSSHHDGGKDVFGPDLTSYQLSSSMATSPASGNLLGKAAHPASTLEECIQ